MNTDEAQILQTRRVQLVFDVLRDRHALINRAVVIVAHPDDEVIGLAGLMKRLQTATFIYTTDGAPRDMEDAERAGFISRDAYREARQRELINAFTLAGINHPRMLRLPFADKEASLNLSALTLEIARHLKSCQPEIVFTHAYEGGHPDHDATAFAVHHALRLLSGKNADAVPTHLEFTSYHEHEGAIRRGSFLTHEQSNNELTLMLPPIAQDLKRRMFHCFASQVSILEEFPIDYERFRTAPLYDFSLPPHAGRLHYETFGWGWMGDRWRNLAQRAAGGLDSDQITDLEPAKQSRNFSASS